MRLVAGAACLTFGTIVTNKIAKLTTEEPWSGYNEQNVGAITTALAADNADTARKVRSESASTRTAPGSSR